MSSNSRAGHSHRYVPPIRQKANTSLISTGQIISFSLIIVLSHFLFLLVQSLITRMMTICTRLYLFLGHQLFLTNLSLGQGIIVFLLLVNIAMKLRDGKRGVREDVSGRLFTANSLLDDHRDRSGKVSIPSIPEKISQKAYSVAGIEHGGVPFGPSREITTRLRSTTRTLHHRGQSALPDSAWMKPLFLVPAHRGYKPIDTGESVSRLSGIESGTMTNRPIGTETSPLGKISFPAPDYRESMRPNDVEQRDEIHSEHRIKDRRRKDSPNRRNNHPPFDRIVQSREEPLVQQNRRGSGQLDESIARQLANVPAEQRAGYERQLARLKAESHKGKSDESDVARVKSAADQIPVSQQVEGERMRASKLDVSQTRDKREVHQQVKSDRKSESSEATTRKETLTRNEKNVRSEVPRQNEDDARKREDREERRRVREKRLAEMPAEMRAKYERQSIKREHTLNQAVEAGKGKGKATLHSEVTPIERDKRDGKTRRRLEDFSPEQIEQLQKDRERRRRERARQAKESLGQGSSGLSAEEKESLPSP